MNECTSYVLCFAGNQTIIIGQPVPSAAPEYSREYLLIMFTYLGFKTYININNILFCFCFTAQRPVIIGMPSSSTDGMKD